MDQALERDLGSGDPEVRRAALKRGPFTAEDADRVAGMIFDVDDAVSDAAVAALRGRPKQALAAPRHVPALVERLDRLGHSVGDEPAEPAFGRLLNVFQALARVGDEAALVALLPFTRHACVAVRCQVCFAIGQIDDGRVAPAIESVLATSEVDRTTELAIRRALAARRR